MPVVRFLPSGKCLHVRAGTNLLQVCLDAFGEAFTASCGGSGTCGKCRVRFIDGLPDNAPAPGVLASEAKAGWRLSCLISVNNDMVIEDPLLPKVRKVILTQFGGRPAHPDADLRIHAVKLAPPSLEDQRDDWKRLSDCLGLSGEPSVGLSALRRLPGRLRKYGFRAEAVFDHERLVALLPPGEGRPLGLAVDVGTTTVAGALCDLRTGDVLATASRTNPQSIRGDDVITRADYAASGPGRAEELRDIIHRTVREIRDEACLLAGMNPECVIRMTVGGNTVMHHLFLGLDASAIVQSPFTPVLSHGMHCPSGTAGDEDVYALPNVSGYVGGDIVGGVLAHNVHLASDTVVFLDVGTNGEIVLRSGGVSYACATAAGPAFEGARIGRGMRAESGAIHQVDAGYDGDIVCSTIDGVPARGICGTGLLDAAAVLLDYGIIDETGRLLDRDEAAEITPPLSEKILSRLDENDAGPIFWLEHGAVYLSQRDIRELQLAKGAISAGIKVLLDIVPVEASAVDRVLLAGGFGSYLRPQSAVRIGLLPPGITIDKVEAVGNAALAGARLCLLSEKDRQEADMLSVDTKYVELSGRSDFQDEFVSAMMFPES